LKLDLTDLILISTMDEIIFLHFLNTAIPSSTVITRPIIIGSSIAIVSSSILVLITNKVIVLQLVSTRLFIHDVPSLRFDLRITNIQITMTTI